MRVGHLVRFLAVSAVVISMALWISASRIDFRRAPIDFSALPQTALFLETGLTRRQVGSAKVGYLERFDPPQIGLFGNHQFMYFSSAAFGDAVPMSYFFNYWYANVTLPEVLDLLTFAEEHKKLPKDLILVQITTPNNDNGRQIINRNFELPMDINFLSSEDDEGAPLERLKMMAEDGYYELQHTFNYADFILGFFDTANRRPIIDTAKCTSSKKPAAYKFGIPASVADNLPMTIRIVLSKDPGSALCDTKTWEAATRRDGSRNYEYSWHAAPVRDANLLTDDANRGLRLGDDEVIAKYMRRIHDLAQRNGRKVVFIIPPVYESARTSSVDRVFDAALVRVPDLNVLDHRAWRDRAEWFERYDHPSPQYFKDMVIDLKRRFDVPLPR